MPLPKKCTKCNVPKPISDFYLGKEGRPKGYCKICYNAQCKEYENRPEILRKRRERGKKYRQTHRERERERHKIYYLTPKGQESRRRRGRRYCQRHPDRMRERALKRTYGITSVDYEDMLQRQKNCCYICRLPQASLTGRNKHFCVDHDHKTGKIRGLLCDFCNKKLGWFEKNEALIMKYLEENKEK